MLEFYEKRKLKRFLYSWPSIVVLLVILFFLLSSVWDVFKIENDTRAKRAERNSVLSELEERNGVLSAEVSRLKTDRGVEEEIRSKFEVSKKGEGVVVIIDKETEKEEVKERNGFFYRIINLF